MIIDRLKKEAFEWPTVYQSDRRVKALLAEAAQYIDQLETVLRLIRDDCAWRDGRGLGKGGDERIGEAIDSVLPNVLLSDAAKGNRNTSDQPTHSL